MFYVTVISGKKVGFLLGPYSTHEEALENVDRGKSRAIETDPWAHFYYFGTSKWKDPKAPLPNSVFGL